MLYKCDNSIISSLKYIIYNRRPLVLYNARSDALSFTSIIRQSEILTKSKNNNNIHTN